MMPLPNGHLENVFFEITVRLRQRKEPNRAECSGEKLDIGRN
jgi:hypothetical protein